MKNDLYFSSFQDATCKDVPVVKMSKSLGNQGNTNRKLNRVAEVMKKWAEIVLAIAAVIFSKNLCQFWNIENEH